jgi:hypothetical protein
VAEQLLDFQEVLGCMESVSRLVRCLVRLLPSWLVSYTIYTLDAITICRAGWHGGSILWLYSGGVWFESKPEHGLCFCGFPQLQTNNETLLRLGYYRFLLNPFQFISHPTIDDIRV